MGMGHGGRAWYSPPWDYWQSAQTRLDLLSPFRDSVCGFGSQGQRVVPQTVASNVRPAKVAFVCLTGLNSSAA